MILHKVLMENSSMDQVMFDDTSEVLLESSIEYLEAVNAANIEILTESSDNSIMATVRNCIAKIKRFINDIIARIRKLFSDLTNKNKRLHKTNKSDNGPRKESLEDKKIEGFEFTFDKAITSKKVSEKTSDCVSGDEIYKLCMSATKDVKLPSLDSIQEAISKSIIGNYDAKTIKEACFLSARNGQSEPHMIVVPKDIPEFVSYKITNSDDTESALNEIKKAVEKAEKASEASYENGTIKRAMIKGTMLHINVLGKLSSIHLEVSAALMRSVTDHDRQIVRMRNAVTK